MKCDKILKDDALSIEAANLHHEHEWNVYEHVHLPAGKALIPGLIDTCSTYIEHLEVVAQRLIRFARIAGRENVIWLWHLLWSLCFNTIFQEGSMQQYPQRLREAARWSSNFSFKSLRRSASARRYDTQPRQPLPPPTGQSPYHLSIDQVLPILPRRE